MYEIWELQSTAPLVFVFYQSTWNPKTEKMEERNFTDFTSIAVLWLPEESDWSINFFPNYHVFLEVP